MAGNVSGHQIRKPGFVEIVRQTLQETGLSSAHLELEITESTIMQDNERTDVAFENLRHLGISLALDDFGTGYSSLTYLRRFPITRVKVDRSFVEGIPSNAENLATAAAITQLDKVQALLDTGAQYLLYGTDLILLRKEAQRAAAALAPFRKK